MERKRITNFWQERGYPLSTLVLESYVEPSAPRNGAHNSGFTVSSLVEHLKITDGGIGSIPPVKPELW